MQRIVLVRAALSFGILAFPAAAQQSSSTQPSQPTTQSTPGDAQQPSAAPLPPPFPPMPSARPSHRWVDVGRHRAAHSHHETARGHHEAARSSHHATTARNRRAHAQESRKHEHQSAVQLSRREIRQCHKLSYRELMRQSSCRQLMRQELGAADHARHHATHSKKSKAHRHETSRKEDHKNRRHRR
jgi:hypothetical protein